jgi:hypothetical protein
MPRTSVARHGCFNKGTIRRLAPWDLAARFQNLVFCFAAFAARTMARILERALADRFFFRFGCRVAGWNFFRVSEPRHAGPRFASLSSGFLAMGSLMYSYRLALFFTAVILLTFLAHAASAQPADHMKATAPEKMMPAERMSKMRECKKRAEEQKIKMEDRSHFVDECVWAKAK